MFRRHRVLSVLVLSAATALGQSGESVSINYDSNHVPHIYGATDRAAFYGLGYAQGLDFPIMARLNIFNSSGRLAEVIGRGTVNTDHPLGINVDSDWFIRLWQIPEAAERDRLAMTSSARALVEAFACGLNDAADAWLAGTGGLAVSQLVGNTYQLQLGSSALVTRLLQVDVTPKDVIAHVIRMNGNTTLLGTAAAAGGDCVPVVGLTPAGSNGWAVSSDRSTTGKALFSSDPHLDHEREPLYRSYWYHLVGSTLTWRGWSLVGSCLPAMGTSDTVAFTLTANSPIHYLTWRADTSSGATQYPLDAGTSNVERVPLDGTMAPTINYWDPTTGTVAAETSVPPLVFADTVASGQIHLYPVIREDTTGLPTGVSSRIWYSRGTFIDAPNAFDYTIAVLQAQNVTQLLSAVSTPVITYNNIIAADTSGGVLYLWGGRVPDHSGISNIAAALVGPDGTTPVDWCQVQDGTKGALRWTAVHAATSLPYELKAGPFTGGATGATYVNDNADPRFVNSALATQVAALPANKSNILGSKNAVASALLVNNYRQARGLELIRDASGAISPAANEAAARDIRDNYAYLSWPRVKDAYLQYCPATGGGPAWCGTTAAATLISKIDALHAGSSTVPPAVLDRDSEGAALWTLVRAWYETLMEALPFLGSYAAGVETLFQWPDQVPSQSNWLSNSSYATNRLAAALAIFHVANNFEPNILNDDLLASTFTVVGSVEPGAFSSMPSGQLSYGQIHCYYLPPAGSTTHFFLAPMDGGYSSLFASASNDFLDPSGYAALRKLPGLPRGILEDPAGNLAMYFHQGGSRSMITAEMTTPPTVKFLSAIGNTEIASDSSSPCTHPLTSAALPCRYATARDFIDGNWQTIVATLSALQAGNHTAIPLSYVPCP